MIYVLEKISDSGSKKILDDASYNQSVMGALINRRFPEKLAARFNWAIDVEGDSYLFRAPTFAREAQNEFWFWFNRVMYVVQVQDSLRKEKKTCVLSGNKPVVPVPDSLKAALADAFLAYGLLGDGPRGGRGAFDAPFDVVPLFET